MYKAIVQWHVDLGIIILYVTFKAMWIYKITKGKDIAGRK